MRQKFEHIMRLLESSNPSICLHKEKIEEYLSKFTRTPDHPPYASMIERAITELNEKGGSSEETISKFIESEYGNLPIAHATQLTHHLQKLVNKGEIVSTSANCYMLSFENPDSLHKLKKGRKRPGSLGQNRQNSRQHKSKRIQSKEQKSEETQNQSQIHLEIFEGIEEQEQAEEQQIGSIGEHKRQEQHEMIEEQNELEEVQLKVVEEQIEAEEDREGNEEPDQMQELQNERQNELNQHKNQVLSEQIDVAVEANYLAEGSTRAEKNSEVTEAEYQKEQEDQIIEERYHKEQESKKPEEKIQTENQESEARDEQAQLSDTQIEEMEEQINTERRHCRMSEEQERLQEQKMEVCRQIFCLRNMLQQFLRKEREDKAPMIAGNYTTSQKVDLFDSSHLTKEEFMELLKTTNKIEGKLINIISSSNLEILENNSSVPKTGGQQEFPEKCLLQTPDTCTENRAVLVCDFQPKQQQQLGICGQVKVAECQPKTISASVSSLTDSMQLEEDHEMELPSHKRPPEVETTTLEELLEKQNKQIKLCNQQEASKAQPMGLSLDVPCDSPHDENGSAELVIQRIETVLEDDSVTTEPNIKFSGEAATSGPETEKSYLDVSMDSEQLQNSEFCGHEKLPEPHLGANSVSVPMELQGLDFGLQDQATSHNKEENPQYKQPENSFEGRHVRYQVTAVELISETQQQMVEQGHEMQVQPPTQKLLVSQVDTATTVAKQCGNTEQIQQQQEPRQLRPRGRRPSESEPVLTTVEDDHELKQKSQPSISERPQEQQRNHHGQKKQLKTQPTTVMADSIITTQQQVNWRLRQRLPHGQGSSLSGSVGQKTREEALPFQHQQHEQKRPQLRHLKRPPKLKSDVDTAMGELVSLDHQHHQQKSQCRGRGRPPKTKANTDATEEGYLLSNHQNHNDKQPQHRCRGRPPKSKLAAMAGASLPPLHQNKHKKQRLRNQGQEHPPKSISSTATDMDTTLLSLQQQHKSHVLGRVTACKAREAAASTPDASLPSQHKRRGRPKRTD
ncbi:HMG-Y-related protein A [Melia azedarach]|uniref:HMG-Y-related protein A n=1 Tax=Melia azedarach TaxID=155640 RepID=A0ACC1XWV1_MELAZ|nr:HMG-Y-related protein A [Melia azedarach]